MTNICKTAKVVTKSHPRAASGSRAAANRNSENVKTDGAPKSKKQASTAPPKLVRTTFTTSREMDFFSEKELVTQTGHDVREWPLVFAKETIDNALDAAEEADIAPVIEVVADATGINVKDNGPGLPEATLNKQLDFRVRASNRDVYVAPDRGKQGNALKTLLPMPVVVDPKHGKLIVMAHGKRHVITCGADPISQRPIILDDVTERPTAGTEIRIEWAAQSDSYGLIWPFDKKDPTDDGDFGLKRQFRDLIEGFALFNPHATFHLDWFGSKTKWLATNRHWPKWKPCRPTSPHWYELQHLLRLLAAYVTHDRDSGTDRLVSDVLQEFDGLTGSQKLARVLEETGLKRVKLSALVVNGQLDSNRIAALLASMQRHTRPVKSKSLGVIGQEHFKSRLLAMGVKEESFQCRPRFAKDGMPQVLEAAFGYLGADVPDARRIFSGVNWSAAIRNPFRSFGNTGEGLEAVLSDLKVGAHEPIVFVLHVAHPRVEYTDRGKSALIVQGGAA
jgi:DNA topoisomerase VI subunit B